MAATTSTHRLPFAPRAHQGINGRQDFSETHVGIPFHGSCSRCHHFHTNYSFTFSLNSTVHTRLFCERCDHPMFGLGRVSTQNTLASVESGSTSAPRACVDRLGQQSALQAEGVPSISGPGPLTTITERKSPAPSRSTSNIRSPTATLPATSLTSEEASGSVVGEERVENRASPNGTVQQSPEEQHLRPQTATLRRLRTIGRRFKQRFYAKSREWRLPRIRLQTTYTQRAGITGHPSTSGPTTEVSSGQEPTDSAEQLVNGTEDDLEDRHASLRARRRELTLAREREVAKCECGPECACNCGSHAVQVDSTENVHIPGYIVGQLHSSTGSSNSQRSQNSTQGPDLLYTGIGGHFDSPRRSSSADESSSAAENGPRRFRLSQGSTLWSSGSSISLRARRPPVGRASSMPGTTRAQYLASLRTGSQSSSLIVGANLSETAGAFASLDERSIPRRISYTESIQNREVSSHESSTSLSNLLNSQDEEQLVDGVSPTSHTPMRDGDEVTPTPHSGIHLNGDSGGALSVGSEGLSSTLQDLASHDITNHEVHPSEFPPL